MKKHIAHLLRRVANRIDPPFGLCRTCGKPKDLPDPDIPCASCDWGDWAPVTTTTGNGHYRLTFLR